MVGEGTVDAFKGPSQTGDSHVLRFYPHWTWSLWNNLVHINHLAAVSAENCSIFDFTANKYRPLDKILT